LQQRTTMKEMLMIHKYLKMKLKITLEWKVERVK
jgi:hypothetical protein